MTTALNRLRYAVLLAAVIALPFIGCATTVSTVKDCSVEAVSNILDDVNTAIAAQDWRAGLAGLVDKFGDCALNKAVTEIAGRAEVRAKYDNLESTKAERAKAWLAEHKSSASLIQEEIPMQIAVVNKSKRLADRDVDAMAEACNRQVEECASAYGITPTPVSFYSTDIGLPASDCRIMAIVDTLDEPGALGYHTDDFGVVYGRILAQDDVGTGITLSHECLEELIDPTCDAWRDMGAAHRVALEVCDPVEGDAYPVQVTILGEQRQVLLSNYVLPRWFDPGDLGSFDRMQRLIAPFTMTPGGYMIVSDAAGNIDDVYAQKRRARAGGERGRASLGAKLGNPDSRLYRRLTARARVA